MPVLDKGLKSGVNEASWVCRHVTLIAVTFPSLAHLICRGFNPAASPICLNFAFPTSHSLPRFLVVTQADGC